jgi:hypothetical protein
VDDQQVEVIDRGGRTFHFAIDPESGDSRLEWITRNGIDLIYLEYENETLCALKDAAGYTGSFAITTTASSPSTATSRKKKGCAWPASTTMRATA